MPIRKDGKRDGNSGVQEPNEAAGCPRSKKPVTPKRARAASSSARVHDPRTGKDREVRRIRDTSYRPNPRRVLPACGFYRLTALAMGGKTRKAKVS